MITEHPILKEEKIPGIKGSLRAEEGAVSQINGWKPAVSASDQYQRMLLRISRVEYGYEVPISFR